MTYLQPTGAGPLQGQDLNRFLQQWMAGVIGAGNLDQTLIRPYDQSEPPVIPESGTAWMAFSQRVDQSDTYPHVAALPDGTGTVLQRHEEIALLCSFYDLGTNGQAASLASLLRDGVTIPDNLEPLSLVGFGMVGCEPEIVVPSLLKQRWLYRVDLPFRLRRVVTRTYGVPNITSAVGTVYTDTGLPPVPVLAHN